MNSYDNLNSQQKRNIQDTIDRGRKSGVTALSPSAEPEAIGFDIPIFLPGGRRGRFVLPSLASPAYAAAVTKQLRAIVKIIAAQGRVWAVEEKE